MKDSIRLELTEHVQALINDNELVPDNLDDWHFRAFNEDYYLIGYYNCEQWLKKHDVSAFEAISTIVEYEQDNYGLLSTQIDNAETVVNMYVYILGEDIISEWEHDEE